jgi:integrase
MAKKKSKPKEKQHPRGVFERPPGSGCWWVRYSDQYGREHREKVGFKSAALSIYQQRKTEIRQGKFDPEDIERKHKNVLVSEIIKDFEKASEARGRKSLDDIRQRLRYWAARLGDRPAKSVLNTDIEDARLDLAQGRLPGRRHKRKKAPRAIATVNRYLATFKSVFLLAIENEKVLRNPFRKVKLQKENNARVRFLTEEEEARILKAVPRPYQAMILFAIHTGVRFSEQIRTKWDDVDLRQRVLTIQDSKSGKARHIPLNTLVLEVLKGIPRSIGCPFVFYTEKGTQRTLMARQWPGWLKQAGVENFNWHDLRHTFASRLVMLGVDLYTVKELLGHHSIEMTQRYAHLGPDFLKRSVELLAQPAPKPAPEIISA